MPWRSHLRGFENEWLHRYVFTTHAKARGEVVRYIEGLYNRRRLHSGLGYRTPHEVLHPEQELNLAA
ncbi:integrase core domain-containing protein [Embleya sp. NPDC050154]|uniref:integrase core domain-containing protein n=1 Tax=Embleya sp. NPDC050154 TaxID=3363988 RepID=UPI0037AFCCAC